MYAYRKGTIPFEANKTILDDVVKETMFAKNSPMNLLYINKKGQLMILYTCLRILVFNHVNLRAVNQMNFAK